jgi:hypothetical protein
VLNRPIELITGLQPAGGMPARQGRRGGQKQSSSSSRQALPAAAPSASITPTNGNESGLLGANGNGAVDAFLSSEPLALDQHTVAAVRRSLRDAGVPEIEWLQELQGMAGDGSLQAFLLTIERSLTLKLRHREEEILTELALVQQRLCALRTGTHPFAVGRPLLGCVPTVSPFFHCYAADCDTLSARWWCRGISWPLLTTMGLMYLVRSPSMLPICLV